MEKRKTADEIVNGFKEVGFIYLEGHGIPQSTIDNVFEKVCALLTKQLHVDVTFMNQSAEFFRLPSSVKVRIPLVTQTFLMGMNKKTATGYTRIG